MLSKEDRESVEGQVSEAMGETMENYVESYIMKLDRITIRNRFYYPVLMIDDEVVDAEAPPQVTRPLLFTADQINNAAERARKFSAEGELDGVAFLCIANPSEAASIKKEEEEEAVVNLVLEHYSTLQLLKLFLLSLLR